MRSPLLRQIALRAWSRGVLLVVAFALAVTALDLATGAPMSGIHARFGAWLLELGPLALAVAAVDLELDLESHGEPLGAASLGIGRVVISLAIFLALAGLAALLSVTGWLTVTAGSRLDVLDASLPPFLGLGLAGVVLLVGPALGRSLGLGRFARSRAFLLIVTIVSAACLHVGWRFTVTALTAAS